MARTYQTNGAAAVDVYAARYRDSAAVRLPQQLPEERPAQQPAKLPRAKTVIAPFALIGALAALFLLVMVIQAHVRLYEVRSRQGELDRQEAQLDEEISRLQAEYNSKIDLQKIETEAKALGMRQPTANQKIYLELAGADSAEVLSVEEKGFFGKLWDAIKDGVSGVAEYFG